MIKDLDISEKFRIFEKDNIVAYGLGSVKQCVTDKTNKLILTCYIGNTQNINCITNMQL